MIHIVLHQSYFCISEHRVLLYFQSSFVPQLYIATASASPIVAKIAPIKKTIAERGPPRQQVRHGFDDDIEDDISQL